MSESKPAKVWHGPGNGFLQIEQRSKFLSRILFKTFSNLFLFNIEFSTQSYWPSIPAKVVCWPSLQGANPAKAPALT
ncbi:hypothetical protein ACFJP3_004910, partial [Salmonella enterica]